MSLPLSKTTYIINRLPAAWKEYPTGTSNTCSELLCYYKCHSVSFFSQMQRWSNCTTLQHDWRRMWPSTGWCRTTGVSYHPGLSHSLSHSRQLFSSISCPPMLLIDPPSVDSPWWWGCCCPWKHQMWSEENGQPPYPPSLWCQSPIRCLLSQSQDESCAPAQGAVDITSSRMLCQQHLSHILHLLCFLCGSFPILKHAIGIST